MCRRSNRLYLRHKGVLGGAVTLVQWLVVLVVAVVLANFCPKRLGVVARFESREVYLQK